MNNNGWSEKRESLLVDWKRKSQLKSFVHDLTSKRYAHYSKYIEIPMLLTSIATTSLVVFTRSEQQYAVMGVSIASTMLSGLNSLLRFGDLRDSHDNISRGYADIVLDISDILSRPTEERGNALEYIKVIRSRLQQLNSTSPSIPNDIMDKYTRDIKNQISQMVPSTDVVVLNPDVPAYPNSMVMGLTRSLNLSGEFDESEFDMGVSEIEKVLDEV